MRVEDDLKELGENTLDKLKEAIERGDREQALALADYLFLEGKGVHDGPGDVIYAMLDWIARNQGEEGIPEALRFARQILAHGQFALAANLTQADFLKLYAEYMRGHRSGPGELGDIEIWEEDDRWVLSFDPCGSGGRMARGPQDGSGSRTEPPFNLGKTSSPQPWAWGKVGVPYYCAHCCVWNEIMGIEANGYPSRITEYPADDPSKPCRWYFYKDPNLIPEEYFQRVGFKKDPSRFKR